MVDWNLYRSFLAVIRSGSLSEAGRRLKISQPTVGRHVALLEESLGLPLFIRTRDGLSPNDSALSLIGPAEAMEAAAGALERSATGRVGEIAGVVRLTASEIIGLEVLPPILTALQTDHPGLVFELSITNANEDILRRDADIAIRMARPTQQALVVRSVGPIPIGLFATSAYLQRRPAPKNLADLEDRALIGFDREFPSAIGDAVGRPLQRALFSIRCDSHAGQLAAVRAGAGIGVCQAPLAAVRKDLDRVLPDVGFDMPVWLVMHEDMRGDAKAQAVFSGVAEGLSTYARTANLNPDSSPLQS